MTGYGSIPKEPLVKTHAALCTPNKPPDVGQPPGEEPSASSLTALLRPLRLLIRNLGQRLRFSAPEQAHAREGSLIQALEGVLLPVLLTPNAGFHCVRSPQVTSLIFLG